MDRRKTNLISKLREFKKQNKIDKMYLFGSMASGKVHNRSDIDLVVVSKKFRGRGVLNRAPQLYLKWHLDYPVDFLCYTPEEFNKQKKRITIVRTAVEEGVAI